MSAITGISWCDSTFNPWIGCTKVSPACDHCYAERDMAIRRKRVEWGAGKPRSRTSAANWKLPERWNRQQFVRCTGCGWRGAPDERFEESGCPECGPDAACDDVRRRVFCASLGDWLDNEVPIEWLVDLLDLVRRTPNLDWLLLSKRIGNWRARINDALIWANNDEIGETAERWGPLKSMLAHWLHGTPPPNVWIGATVVNQDEADRDVPKLLCVPAAVRFLSVEPMLGSIVVPAELIASIQGTSQHGQRFIDWVICGGESGAKVRPMNPDWVRSLRDQCSAAGVAFHFKQWGSLLPVEYTGDEMWAEDGSERQLEGRIHVEHAHGQWFARRSKEEAGRLLDGRTWDAFPKEAA